MRFYLNKVRLNSQGYEYGKYGKYFGVGEPLYRYESEDGEHYNHIRANDREEAKQIIVEKFKNAKFFN